VVALAIDPINPATLYAGTNGGGVFVYHFDPSALKEIFFPVIFR
jgi:hypothetical protein